MTVEQKAEEKQHLEEVGKELAQAKGLLRAWYQYCKDTKGRTPLQLETAEFLAKVK
jgi:hypothetical protein